MLSSQRRLRILSLVRSSGQVVVQELSREWGLSEDTIRRDLRELSQEGLLRRVHGGALPAPAAAADYVGRQKISPETKERLGKAAAALVHPGQVVAIDGGTSTAAMIRHLPLDMKATIVTHSPTIAAELGRHEQVEVILIGGRLFRHSMVSVGSEAIEAIRRVRADIFFLGATGVHEHAGITTGDWEEAAVKRAFCSCSAATVLMASPEKLDAASPFQILPLEGIDILIVESSGSFAVVKRCEALGITILRA